MGFSMENTASNTNKVAPRSSHVESLVGEARSEAWEVEAGACSSSSNATSLVHSIQDEGGASYITGIEIGGSQFSYPGSLSTITSIGAGLSREQIQHILEILVDAGLSRQQKLGNLAEKGFSSGSLEMIEALIEKDQEGKTGDGSGDGSANENDEETEDGSKEEGDDHADEDVSDKSGKEELDELEGKIMRNNPVAKDQTGCLSREDQTGPPDELTEKAVATLALREAERLSLDEQNRQPGAFPVAPGSEEAQEAGRSPVPFPPGDGTDTSSDTHALALADCTSTRSLGDRNSSDSLEDDASFRSNGQPSSSKQSDEATGLEPLHTRDSTLPPPQEPIANIVEDATVIAYAQPVETRLSGNRETSFEDLEAQVARERRSKILTRILCGLSLFLFLPVIILSSLGMFTQDPNAKDDSSVSNPIDTSNVDAKEITDTMCPHGPRREPFWNVTLEKQLQGVLQDAIGNSPCSSQSLANEWMLADPHLHEYPQRRQLQRFMLASIWYSTNGSHWKNNDHWLNYNVSECRWYSAHPNKTICDEDSVFRIGNLTNNGLQGEIPTEALRLSRMRRLDVSHNELSGVVPFMSKGVSRTMEHMDISYNKLEGQFLVESYLQGMALEHFNARGNLFTGTVPLLYTPNISHLDLRDNLFEGKIPSMLGELGRKKTAMLEEVRLAGNMLTGMLPSQVGLLENLRVVDLSWNAELDGTLPQELGSLLKLELVDLRATQFWGSIPEVLCERESVGELVMAADCGSNPELQCCPPL